MDAEQSLRTVVIVGAGAAGLWTALQLIATGYEAGLITIIEPDSKTANDRTYSYWAKENVLPSHLGEVAEMQKIIVQAQGLRVCLVANPYTYYSVRSSVFYAYAKQVLAKAGVKWIVDKVTSIQENPSSVNLILQVGSTLSADYVLDSRPPPINLKDQRYITTLQHFGGWFIRTQEETFDPGAVVLMDFKDFGSEVGFFYVVPSSSSRAIIQLALFGPAKWQLEEYDKALASYIASAYSATSYDIEDKEYGIIPMTDIPLWEKATSRVWPIGTRGGWVQPSSGYAFTRIARFAREVAISLSAKHPKPWSPSSIQQIFNSVMLGYILQNPEKAGKIFYDLFERNGAETTFDFLDEKAKVWDTLKLMWSCPKVEFTKLALKESYLRIIGRK